MNAPPVDAGTVLVDRCDDRFVLDFWERSDVAGLSVLISRAQLALLVARGRELLDAPAPEPTRAELHKAARRTR